MLEKLRQRRESLLAQREDIDNALRDLDRVEADARQSLDEIRTVKQRRRA